MIFRQSAILLRFGFSLILLATTIPIGNAADATFRSGSSFAVEDSVDVLVAGDFTGNGHSDILTSDTAGRINVLEGDGAGGFGEAVRVAELGNGAIYVEAADLDNNGVMDLVIPTETRIVVLLATGSGNFHPPVFYPAGSVTLAVAIADFNGDGILDVASANILSDDSSVWFGDGSGGLDFQQNYVVGDDPFFLVAEDFNSDGSTDLAVANRLSDNVTILLNDGSGSFSAGEDFPVGAQPMHIIAADFNSDGNLDLATANSASSSLSVLLGRGDGDFEAGPDVPDWVPGYLVASDWNNDQIVDLAIANHNSQGLQIYLGTGDGTFAHSYRYATGAASSFQLAAADFNEDGIMDLAIGTGTSATIFAGLGDGELDAARAIYSGANRPRWTGITDFNGDGLNDVATVGSNWSIGVRLGIADGEFEAPVSYTVSCTDQRALKSGLLADVNADSETDVVAVCRTGGVWALLGNGDGTFQPPVSSPAPQSVLSAETARFDADIFPDIVIASSTATFLLRGNGDGTFQTPEVVAFSSQNLAVHDFNLDGRPDLAIDFVDWDGATDLVLTLLGDGTGQFSLGGARPIGLQGAFENASTADFNEDGFPDLAVTRAVRDTASNEIITDLAILLNDGSGGLEAPIFLGRSTNRAIPVTGDFNNDSHIDIVTSSTTMEGDHFRTILLGHGDGTFDESNRDYEVSGTNVAAGDVNHDGLPDLVVAGPDRFWISFLINTTVVE